MGFKDPLGVCKNIKEHYIALEKAEEKQKEFKSNINETVKQGKNRKRKNAIKNIKTLYESRKKLSNCFMIILELYLKLNTTQNTEEVSKY